MSLVPAAVSRQIARNALLVQKGSPGLLLGAGIVGMVASTVLACRATLKMEEVIGEAKGKLDTARTLEHNDYSESDRSRDISLIYFQTGVKVVRAYGPSIILASLSIAALTRSHNILTTRNAALTAAYTALDRGFKEYRARVVEKYGEEQDRDFRYGAEKVEIVDPETKKKKTVTRVAPGEPSIYAVFFDEGSSSWSKDPDYNFVFLNSQQNYFNDPLKVRGHIFLNEVYDNLGLPRTEPGAVVGWLLTNDDSTDNYVDFGIFDDRDRARDFVHGLEGSILLDFNVDGIIYDKIEGHMEALSWQRGR